MTMVGYYMDYAQRRIKTNRPQRGDVIRVEPIRLVGDIERIKLLLKSNPRNLALFTLGINTNLRASDLVRLTVGQVRDLHVGQEFTLREKKTGKLGPVKQIV